MGLKSGRRLSNQWGNPRVLNFFTLWGTPILPNYLKRKDFFGGNGKINFLQTPKKRNFKTNSSRKIRPIIEVSPQTPQRRAMGHCQLALRV